MASLSLYFNKLSCQVTEALISPGILFVLFDLFFMVVEISELPEYAFLAVTSFFFPLWTVCVFKLPL